MDSLPADISSIVSEYVGGPTTDYHVSGCKCYRCCPVCNHLVPRTVIVEVGCINGLPYRVRVCSEEILPTNAASFYSAAMWYS
jgi:hypothetical protein